ncbi:sigma-70 family RNA polymerase sigma factor [Mycolicibacterium elephantis]|uniref:RNA polymerase sigma factor SigL n=1 Tax=Mycolicibacterium elephantis DSM 44368 TaxID=1335622 RepID=A0A439E0X5_9MYCO|nr:sigma-70 family RNA polymerase sigma factor [Mycolicibacterium elephantis]MCV7221585.1 sigma-70 family RNA polymerase sigma factor [Mycolicibacterium elephantis]RWA24021.1 RNA polymerase sigma factor SigL [Mycolicibacterium elephantis DSM 44368]
MTEPDQAALLRAIHDAHGQSLLRYVLRLTRGDMPFAEDVVQESLLRLWRKPELLAQPSDSVRAWLFTVARNQVIDDRRSARFGRELQTGNVPEPPSADTIGSAVDKWVLADALKSLSAEHRTAIVRAYYLGQTVADIAEKEGIPVGTVKSRLHYALRALRDALQEKGVVS